MSRDVKTLALLFAVAALCAPQAASSAGRSEARCLLAAQIGRSVDPKHPLIDGLGSEHVLGMHVVICARDPSGDVVTLNQAIDAARSFLKDNNLDCAYADARQGYMDEQKRELEWNVHFECKMAKSPLIPPFVAPPRLREPSDKS